MSIRIDRPRFRNIFARMEIAQAPADDFVDAIEDTVNRGREGLATKNDLDAMENRMRADAAEREARMTRSQLIMVGVMLGAIAVAVTVILAVLA